MSRGLDPSRARLKFRPRPMLKPLDEGGCVARLTAEHAEISAGWFDAHARDLAGYATRRVGPTVASDIVADTFRIAWEQLDSYNPGRGGERAWLFGIASNLIRRHWHTEERRLRIQAQSVRADIQPVDPLLRVE